MARNHADRYCRSAHAHARVERFMRLPSAAQRLFARQHSVRLLRLMFDTACRCLIRKDADERAAPPLDMPMPPRAYSALMMLLNHYDMPRDYDAIRR